MASILNVTDVFELPMEAAGKEVTVEGWTFYKTGFNHTVSGPFSGQMRDRYILYFQGEVDSWQWDPWCPIYRLTGIVRFNESDLICTCRVHPYSNLSAYGDVKYVRISDCANEQERPILETCLANTTRGRPFLELTGSPGEPACPEGLDPQGPSKGPDAWWRNLTMRVESAG